MSHADVAVIRCGISGSAAARHLTEPAGWPALRPLVSASFERDFSLPTRLGLEIPLPSMFVTRTGRRLWWVGLVCLLALVAAACGGSSDESADADAAPAPADAGAGVDDGAEAGAPAADQGPVFPIAGGGQLAINDLAGTPTLLWFWAPW